jgi:uncharacterized membrane protein
MQGKAAITVNRSREEVQRLWESPSHRPEYISGLDVTVTFKDAPGDWGTEIHVDLGQSGKLGGVIQKVATTATLPKVKDDLRRFKAHAETGVIPRSEGSPEGELAERKLKQRPAQPLEESELQKAGVR